MNDHVGYWKRTTGDEGFLGGRIAGTVGLQVHGMNFSPAPVEDIHGILILGGKLCTIAESHPCG